MMRVITLILQTALFLTLTQAPLASAEEYTLFKKGVPVANYNALIEHLLLEKHITPNDLLVFEDKNYNPVKFKVLEVLGNGDFTVIVDIGDGLALRISKRADGLMNLVSYTEGSRDLKDANIPMVSVHFDKSNVSQFIVVDKFEHDFTLFDLIYNNFKRTVTFEEKERAYQALVTFAQKTWMFSTIGDFMPSQLAYNMALNEWRLLDWNHENYLWDYKSLTPERNHFFFEYVNGQDLMPLWVQGRIREAIVEARIGLINKLRCQGLLADAEPSPELDYFSRYNRRL